jgi:tRNA(Ser,Leu) C12 N-acetylase TAN1
MLGTGARKAFCLPEHRRRRHMKDWNVAASVHEGAFLQACELLEEFGPVRRTDFFNVLVIRVDDIHRMMEGLRIRVSQDPDISSVIGRVVPVTQTFSFQSPEEFESKAKEAVLKWVPELAGKSFHVRMHRRGFKGRLSSEYEEKFLDNILLEALEKAGGQGRISFDDPDAIVAIETVGPRAGLSLWAREELKKYPFLGLD